MRSDTKFKFKIMKRTILYLLSGFILTSALTSCIKDQDTPVGDAGKPIVKFNDGPKVDNYYLPFTGTKTADIIFTREANSSDALQKPTEVTILEDATLIPAGFTELPTTNFTYTSDAGVIVTSGKITSIRFAAGEFSKRIQITLIGSAWTNLATKYAKAYKVTDAGTGNQTSVAKASMVVTFAIKNKWDGVYEVISGEMTDVLNPSWGHINGLLPSLGYGNAEYTLKTYSPTQIAYYACYPYSGNQLGRTYVFNAGGGGSSWGFASPIFQFDPATDKVVGVINYYGQPASNTRSFELDPSGVNAYDPVTKTIQVKYRITQPSVVPAAPHIRITMTETLKYIGPTQ